MQLELELSAELGFGFLLGAHVSFFFSSDSRARVLHVRPAGMGMGMGRNAELGTESLCGSGWFGSVWGVVWGGILGGVVRVGFFHRESTSPSPLDILSDSRAELENHHPPATPPKININFRLFQPPAAASCGGLGDHR